MKPDERVRSLCYEALRGRRFRSGHKGNSDLTVQQEPFAQKTTIMQDARSKYSANFSKTRGNIRTLIRSGRLQLSWPIVRFSEFRSLLFVTQILVHASDKSIKRVYYRSEIPGIIFRTTRDIIVKDNFRIFDVKAVLPLMQSAAI